MSSSTYSGVKQRSGRSGPAALRLTVIAWSAVAVLLACILAACSGAGTGSGHAHSAPPGTAAARTPSPAAVPPALATPGWQCLAAARPTVVTLPGALPVAILGAGQRTVVLSDESDENACSWLPLAAELAAAGYRVALYDYTGDPVADLTSVVTYLRTAGARSVELIGASEGAKTSIVVAAGLSPPPDAVVSLSAEELLQGQPVVPFAARLRSATLFVTAQDDLYGAAAASAAYYRSAPAAHKQLLIRPGDQHGTALLSDPVVRQAVLDFLAGHHG